MARRRKKKGNPLLMKIFVGTLIFHAIALPIAAHFGAFKNIKRGPGDARIVMLSTSLKDEPEKPKEKPKAKPKSVKDTKKAASGAKSSEKAKGSNLPQPKVVTSGPATGDGGGGGPAAESGTGTAGKVPEAPKNGGGTAPTEPKKENPPAEPKTTEPEKKPEPKKPDPPKVDPPKQPEPKPKKIIEAEVVEAPEPEIPDDLRSEPFEKTLVVEAQIDTGGHPTDISVVTSTGVAELDKIGLDTAKKYRFRPATVDGVVSEQHVRFRIIFKVE